MRKVTAFELTDGTIVKDEKTAIEQQNIIDLKQSVREFADEVGYHEGRDLIYEAIIDNVEKLREILKVK